MTDTPDKVLAAFDLPGEIHDIRRFGAGHINDSFRVSVRTPQGAERLFLLQRINTEAFHDPTGLMENIVNVTTHLRQRIAADGGDPDRETLTVIPTIDGASFWTDDQGGAWRVFIFLDNTMCYQSAETPEIFAAAAHAFGIFSERLEDYPAASLHETIPHFHDTPKRYQDFERAVAEDVAGRVRSCGAEIDFIRARVDQLGYLTSRLDSGQLPLRVTHNDTKLNNVLMDPNRGASCVIDLDTVMPGLTAYDFGDAIRFGACTAAEDETDLDLVHLSLPLFEAYTAGYLTTARSALTQTEKECLPWGARLMTLECGMRFLADHLQGDIYFHTDRPGHNLDRARTQLTLLAEMEAQSNAMNELVEKYS